MGDVVKVWLRVIVCAVYAALVSNEFVHGPLSVIVSFWLSFLLTLGLVVGGVLMEMRRKP